MPHRAYAEGDAELFAIMADFELTYSQYAELQSQMEHYWCLRWLRAGKCLRERGDRSLRDNLVRFDGIPLYVSGPRPAGADARNASGWGRRIDLLAATLEAALYRRAA